MTFEITELPSGFTDASDEMKREYLAESQKSSEIVDAISDLLESNGRDGTQSLSKQQKAEIYIRLVQE